ncbi:MAG: asparagine synthase (glutamine-hydrolyzing) [Gammaproteobacteria bacterium]
MCGITGIVLGSTGDFNADDLQQMVVALGHRGPNGFGVWLSPDRLVALGHRGLSILDLSPAGHQPMVSTCGRYIVVFNGEIYNHLGLRQELECTWTTSLASLPEGPEGERNGLPSTSFKRTWEIMSRGRSDTETLLAAIVAWGVEGTLKRCVGMFALAVWDREASTLTLARDRFGEKPLYYGWQGNVFLFGSQLKALRAHPAFRAEIDRGALCILLRHSAIPAPYSIYKGIFKLPPGTMLTLKKGRSRELAITPYWSAKSVAEAAISQPFMGTESEAVTELEWLLRQAVAGQMVADVPIGAFLSGGVDSSTVVALMQAQCSQPVKIFSIGFREGYNEAGYAKTVAQYLGAEHREVYVTPREAMDIIPLLPVVYDEPFADPSQIPTLLVAQLARRHVTVALSGEGSDELFGGYNHYFSASSIWRRTRRIPFLMRRLAASALTALSLEGWNRFYEGVPTLLLPRRFQVMQLGDMAHKLATILAAESGEACYRGLVSHWGSPASVVIGASEPPTVLTDSAQWANLPGFEQRLMFLDGVGYLPDIALVKLNRAAMAVSLETRVPFLDHRVVEFGWRLPLYMKIRNGQNKWILRQVLYKYVAQELVERPKMGFGVPIDTWLRGPLRDWAEALLAEGRLKQEGFFHPEPIRRKWRAHLSGARNWENCVWNVLMFQAWLEAQGKR